MIRTGQARGVLVIGSEVYSRILNWQDRGTCVLFGDGAGAVFLRAGKGSGSIDRGILSTHLHAQGTLGDILYVDGAVGRHDKPGASGDERPRGVSPRGDPAGRGGGGSARRQWTAAAATSTGWCRTRPICASSMRWAASWALPPERVVITVDRHANTSAASVPLALGRGVPRRTHSPGRSGADGGARRRADLGFRAGAHVKLTYRCRSLLATP